MSSKVIKLTDNNNVTLLPVTDSAYIQHSVFNELSPIDMYKDTVSAADMINFTFQQVRDTNIGGGHYRRTVST